MQDLTKYCPHCKEWVFHLQGLCPKCNYIFPQTPPNQEEHEELEPTYENQIHQSPQIDNSFDEEEDEEESVWEKYAPWNEWKLNPWDKHPWEWNPWENTNNDTSNNDPWNPFNNDPWNHN